MWDGFPPPGGETMIDLKVQTLESAPAASQPLMQRLKEQVGFVPNLAATMAGSPTLLDAFLTLRSVAAGASLDPAAREIVAIAVAVETRCLYCVAAHSTFALGHGAPTEAVQALRNGELPAEARLRALSRFAQAIVRREGAADRARDLLGLGFTEAQLLEVLAVIAVPLLAGSVHQLKAVSLDPAFQPQAWLPPAGPEHASRREDRR
jgi:uncharacterized peroxidase-related enzyme